MTNPVNGVPEAREKQQALDIEAPRQQRQAASSIPGRRTLTGGLPEGDGLPYRQKSLFESALGRNLSGVRVHTGDAAAEQASAQGARAFVVGQDIVFNRGEYRPDTPEGDRLLAHEVAHTVQQSGADPAGSTLARTTPGDGAERDADAAATAMVAGTPTTVSSQPMAIARKGLDERISPPDGEQMSVEGPREGEPRRRADDDAMGVGGNEGVTGEGASEVGNEGGDLTVQRVGMEELAGDEPVGAPQNLEAGKQEIAAKGAALQAESDTLLGPTAGAPARGVAPDGGGGGGGVDAGADVELPEDLKMSVAAAKADADEAAADAKTQSDAYKADLDERRDRFDAEQQALTLEQLKTMSAADKRSTLIEMGFDQKSVKKMSDAALDGMITGKLETEQRKTRILGMTPEELAALSAERKMQFLVDLGVDRGDLEKIGPQKAAAAFDEVVRVAHVPGQHKVKIKIKGGLFGKSWNVNVDVDAEGNADFDVEKKGGFFSKLWGWIKAALPIILMVLAPLTGGATLIALAVYQAVTAIANGNWLGAIIGVAGAFVGIGALAAIKNGTSAFANGFRNIASVASKVKKVADAARATMTATKAKSPGSLLAALASGASGFADVASKAAGGFADKMSSWADRLDKWSKIVSGGEQVINGIKTGDPAAAVAGAFEAAAAAVSKKEPAKKDDDKSGTTSTKSTDTKVETSKSALTLQRYARIAEFASAGTKAAKGHPPDYGAIVDSAMKIAGELSGSKKLGQASKITSAASRLTRAIQTKDPGQLAAAALALAEAIQLAKYDADHEGESGGDEDREQITKRYERAQSIVTFASSALKAAAAKPRPNYPEALDAATQLIASLTESKKLDQAAVLTSRFDAWTSAVRSRDEQAILDAGIAFGEAINDMRELIEKDRADAKQAAQATLAPGETLAVDGPDTLPAISLTAGLAELPGTVLELETPPALAMESGIDELPGSAVDMERGPLDPRGPTPNANYTVFDGDSLSRIAKAFHVPLATLLADNPQIVGTMIYSGQKLFVRGADKLLTGTITDSPTFTIDPAVVEAQREAEVARARTVVKVWREQIELWRHEGGLGNDFPHYVDGFEREVDGVEGMLRHTTTTVETIKTLIRLTGDSFMRMWNLYSPRHDLNGTMTDVLIFAAETIRDGAGLVLSTLDRSRIISTSYKGVITAINEWQKGGDATSIAVRSSMAAVIALAPSRAAKGQLESALNEACRRSASLVNDYMADLHRNDDLTDAEKAELGRKFMVRLPLIFIGGAIRGRLSAMNAESKADNLERMVGSWLHQMFERVLKEVTGGR